MNEVTLESLAKRVEALERALQMRPARQKDWRRVAGMFEDNEFSRRVDAEGQAIRKAERDEACRPERAE